MFPAGRAYCGLNREQLVFASNRPALQVAAVAAPSLLQSNFSPSAYINLLAKHIQGM